MDAQTVTDTLAKPVAQELLFSDIPARLSYVGVDGDPRKSSAELGRAGADLIVARTVDAIRKATARR